MKRCIRKQQYYQMTLTWRALTIFFFLHLRNENLVPRMFLFLMNLQNSHVTQATQPMTGKSNNNNNLTHPSVQEKECPSRYSLSGNIHNHCMIRAG